MVDIELEKGQEESVLLDRDGNIIHRFTPWNLSSGSEIPENLSNAFIAIEDERFYRHLGIDPLGVIRAAYTNFRAQEIVAGGSTITQQLAKNAFLSPERTFSRKIQELILALRLEQRYQKEEILLHYLNHIYFGHGVYGVGEAAHFFFQKEVQALKLEEMAVLAAITRAPALYSPLLRPERVLARRNLVLDKMEELEMITGQEAEKAQEAPLKVTDNPRDETTAPFFLQHIWEELQKHWKEKDEIPPGLTIHSTLDPRVQEVVEGAREVFLSTAVHPPQLAVIVLDPKKGSILALVGGKDDQESTFNRATRAQRQSGSVFKPITFAWALESGLTPLSSFYSRPTTFQTLEGNYQPQNFNAHYREREITLREALRYSDNVVAVKIQEEVTVEKTIALAQQMGIESPLPQSLSLVLGTGSVTLLEMVQAYSVFANQGFLVPAHGIKRVTTRKETLYTANWDQKRVLKEGTAFLITHMLQEVITQGTARKIRDQAPTHGAGKTGTSQQQHDAYFVGYTQEYLTGIWIGYDEPKDLGGTGGELAAPLWADIMGALDGDPSPGWVPQGVQEKSICQESHQLAGPGCPNPFQEYFLPGSSPYLYCQKHGEKKIPGNLFQKRGEKEEEGEKKTLPDENQEQGIKGEEKEQEEIQKRREEKIRRFLEDYLPNYHN